MAYEEAGLGNSKEDTGDEEVLEVVDEAHSDHDSSPANHDDWQPH